MAVKADELPPQVEDDGDEDAIDALTQIKLALGNSRVHRSSQVIHEDGDDVTTDRSGVMVTHTRSKRVRLYKGTPERPVCRIIPAANGNLERLLDPGDGGWSMSCPACGTDCGGATWGCGKAEEPSFYQCPVPTCNVETGGPKKFYERHLDPVLTADPKRLVDAEMEQQAGMSMARAQMRSHIRAYHPDVADAMGIPK